ncbi:hypothetical protein QTP70_016623 [Hemibagrus guttatus]|uniref:BZIP domain-containing protein n=1 Tax=Hemibagrus guttatus TaxID=175788 RepID=A0AAE0REA6_9TELE|nr:hypothetical protein QTP70_016623 [Hemibagrus guttatus]
MDTKDSSLQVKIGSPSTFNQDSALHQQASVDSKDEKCRKDIIGPGSYRKYYNYIGSLAPSNMGVSEMLTNEQAAPPSVQAPTDDSTMRSQIYAFKPKGGIQIGKSAQSFKISTSNLTQSGPAFVNCPVLSRDVARNYAPSNRLVVEAATGDVSAYQICAPTTSLPQGVAMASSPSHLHSSQQLAEEASRKRELRLMKNRQAAKECRRRKREYVNCLEAQVSMLQLQNKKLMEELKYLKGICAHQSS